MVIVRSPLRISIAGGGTDMREYYRAGSAGFGAVCSLAINKYVYVTVNNLSDYFPHRFRIAYSKTELTQDSESVAHPIVREALKARGIRGGIDVNVMSDIPAGTGMGSSSTFTVSLLHALTAFQNKMIPKEDLASEAARLEMDILREPIGKQDHYAAAFGGFNLFKFHANEQVSVEPLPLSTEAKNRFRSYFLLFYLGGQRSASSILKEQSSRASGNLGALTEMRDQALTSAKLLCSFGLGDQAALGEIGKVLRRGWELKKQLADGISNTEVDRALESALQAGALGGRLLGAGGTGFLLVCAEPGKHAAVRRTMESFKEIHFDLDDLGSTVLYYGNS